VTLPADWQKHALALIPRARTVNGDFFRSVELSYALPDDVISGEGSRQHGGRFVKPGVRAVYGSEEQTAVAEAAYRRRRLAAGSVIAELPRIMYVISVKVGTAVDLTAVDPDVEALLPACVLADVLILRSLVNSRANEVFTPSCSPQPRRALPAPTSSCFGM
jgi:hypothetical protein